MGRIKKQHNIKELSHLIRGLAGRIKTFRFERGLSQKEFALRAGVSQTTIHDIERELATDVQFSTVFQIAKVLNVPVSEFLRGSDLKLTDPDRQELLQAAETLGRLSRKLK